MKGKLSTIAVGHIGLNVSDMDISEGFYQEVLGLRVAEESVEFPFRYASLARDGKTVLTLWEQSGGRFKKRRPGLHHLAFEAGSVEEVNRTKALSSNADRHSSVNPAAPNWGEAARKAPEAAKPGGPIFCGRFQMPPPITQKT
jgi:catechol-2,3-dioxygenase